jgi:hypothetical protein
MGITVTTNLGLIKPDTSESIREALPTFTGWAAQNTVNADKLDTLFRAATASYTPVWGGTTSPPTLGAGGFTEGKYIRIFPRMVAVFFRLFLGGAGAAVGSGSYTIDLPVAIDPAFATPSVFSVNIPVGKAIYQDNSAVLTSSNFTLHYSVTFNKIMAYTATGGTWSPTIPTALQQQDRFSGYFIYPTAVP